jgi:hypothetical protein
MRNIWIRDLAPPQQPCNCRGRVPQHRLRIETGHAAIVYGKRRALRLIGKQEQGFISGQLPLRMPVSGG